MVVIHVHTLPAFLDLPLKIVAVIVDYHMNASVDVIAKVRKLQKHANAIG